MRGQILKINLPKKGADTALFEVLCQSQHWMKVLCMGVRWKVEILNAKIQEKQMTPVYPIHSWLNGNETVQKGLCLLQATEEGDFALITT